MLDFTYFQFTFPILSLPLTIIPFLNRLNCPIIHRHHRRVSQVLRQDLYIEQFTLHLILVKTL